MKPQASKPAINTSRYVEPGSVVVITEGPKPVGYLHVDQVVTG